MPQTAYAAEAAPSARPGRPTSGRVRALLLSGLSLAALAVAGAASAGGPATTTTLSSNHNPAVIGAQVIFTATVFSGQPVDQGVVRFLENGTSPLIAALNGSGQASEVVTFNSIGTYVIAADYQGTADLNASSSQLTETVDANTVTSLSSASSVVIGQLLTLTANVAPVDTGGTPAGDVSFFDGATLLGSTALDGSDAASLQINSELMHLGQNQITAVYAGQGYYLTSTSAQDGVTVNVPEPASWAMLVLGFATIGAAVRRRREGLAGLG